MNEGSDSDEAAGLEGCIVNQVSDVATPPATAEVADALEVVSRFLDQAGQVEYSERVERAIAVLRELQVASPPPGGVITTGEAARLLGIRSVNTIKRWVHDGTLAGYRRGSRILVSRDSVDQLLDSSRVQQQQAWEQEITEALAPFDASEEEIPAPGETWTGKKPWPSASPDASEETAA
jgi:excisionase family DNA binding protein